MAKQQPESDNAEAFRQMMRPEEKKSLLEAIKDAVVEVAPGLSVGKILGDVGAELGRQVTQGRNELAGALFAGSAFVPYGPGQVPPEVEGVHGKTGAEKFSDMMAGNITPAATPDKGMEQSRGMEL